MNPLAEERQIRQLFEKLTIAWNKGDSQVYTSYFTDNCDYVTPQGDYIKGKKATAAFHQQLFNGSTNSAQLINEVEDIRFLSPDIALVHCSITRLSWHKDAPATSQSVSNNILIRELGEWKIEAYHHCHLQEVAQHSTRKQPLARFAALV